MAESFLLDHPDLRTHLLTNARPTGKTIGSGAYGSVEEVVIPGAVCAAKKIHDFFQDPTEMSPEEIEMASRAFVRECQLMSTIRHPHIVMFLGVCFLPGSRMPAMVMEKLLTSLHDILDPEPPPPSKIYIPVNLKRSILHDVANGLYYLHTQTPPIIHRDLSAKNILLSSGMVAKIADLGMARIVPSFRAAKMTKAPGASIYMPPEALEDESRYDVTIDIFSLGVIAIFTLSQTFPKPLAAAYMDENKVMIGRTELERRGCYLLQIQQQIQEDHPLLEMIRRCLNNCITDRPTIEEVVHFLEQARVETEYDMNKLTLMQDLKKKTELLESKEEHIDLQRQQNEIQKEQIYNLERKVAAGQTEVAELKLKVEILQWEKLKDIPIGRLVYGSSVVINEVVYWGGNDISDDIVQYNPGNGSWSKLPRAPMTHFTMTSLDEQLVLVGGLGDTCSNKLTVWDSDCGVWVHPYSPMPTERRLSAAVGHNGYLVVACGFPHRAIVDVLNCSSGSWYSAQPVPTGGRTMSSVVVDGRWYLSSFGGWKDGMEHIYWVQLSTLISSATSTSTNSTSTAIWHELPSPPVIQPSLAALKRHLLLVGGKGYVQELHYYDQDCMKWSGQLLPVGMFASCCAVLPSGALMVTGGFTVDTGAKSKRTWTRNIAI